MTLTSSKPGQNPYKVLQIDPRADDSAIKRAYFRMVRQYPPEQAPEKFQEVRTADVVAQQLTDWGTGLLKCLFFLLQPPPSLPNRRRPTYDLSVHTSDLDELALELGLAPYAPANDFRVPSLPVRE